MTLQWGAKLREAQLFTLYLKTERAGKRIISYDKSSNRKVYFQMSAVCLVKTVLIAAATTLSKFFLFVLREQRATTNEESVLASGCRFLHAASAVAHHYLT